MVGQLYRDQNMDLDYVVVDGPKGLENHLTASVASGGLNRNPRRSGSIDACSAMTGTVAHTVSSGTPGRAGVLAFFRGACGLCGHDAFQEVG